MLVSVYLLCNVVSGLKSLFSSSSFQTRRSRERGQFREEKLTWTDDPQEASCISLKANED